MINTTHILNNLEGIASESAEVIELLKIIYSQCDEHASKISSGVGCAIRSLRSTTSQINSLISTTLDSTDGSKTKDSEDAFSHRIQLARENLGLSEANLARKLNTYSDHISDWECGITEPPASMIIPLAHALKCDPLWLLTGNNAEVVE